MSWSGHCFSKQAWRTSGAAVPEVHAHETLTAGAEGTANLKNDNAATYNPVS